MSPYLALGWLAVKIADSWTVTFAVLALCAIIVGTTVYVNRRENGGKNGS